MRVMFFFLIICALSWGIVVLPAPAKCLNEATFHREKGKYLANSVIRTEHTNSEFECSSYCSREDSCVSVNYKNSGDGRGLCELNNGLLEDAEDENDLNKPEFNHLSIIKRDCKDMKRIFSPGTKTCVTMGSCKELLDRDGSFENGVYELNVKGDPSQKYSVYCHMTDIQGCGGGGWTLVMKLNGSKNTFAHSSPYWTDMVTYQVQEGLEGLTDKETKLESYWKTPFTKICLGMKVSGVTNWIKLDYQATSLYSVIADGTFRKTTAGRSTWKSLMQGSSLQSNCNKEGFNNNHKRDENIFINMRLGIRSNNENDCDSCDSWIGFGVSFRGCSTSTITSGNMAACDSNGGKMATGYILVQ